MFGSMRRKTSLTLGEDTIAAARASAANDGKNLSAWVEQAIRNEIGRHEVGLIEEWEGSLGDEDRAVLAALAAADAEADTAQADATHAEADARQADTAQADT